MPTETDLLILAADLDRSDSDARAYAASLDAETDTLEYVRSWAREALMEQTFRALEGGAQ